VNGKRTYVRDPFDIGPECRRRATKKADVLRAKVVGDYIDCMTSNLAYLVFTVGSEACRGGLQR